MYETMVYWETASGLTAQPPFVQDFADIWRAADKIVYSRTLEAVSSARTRIERHFDADTVRQLKETTGRDITVGGPDLAAQALQAGLVDEYHLFVAPRRRGRRHEGPSGQPPTEARAHGRTAIRQRRGLPPLPHIASGYLAVSR